MFKKQIIISLISFLIGFIALVLVNKTYAQTPKQEGTVTVQGKSCMCEYVSGMCTAGNLVQGQSSFALISPAKFAEICNSVDIGGKQIPVKVKSITYTYINGVKAIIEYE